MLIPRHFFATLCTRIGPMHLTTRNPCDHIRLRATYVKFWTSTLEFQRNCVLAEIVILISGNLLLYSILQFSTNNS